MYTCQDSLFNLKKPTNPTAFKWTKEAEKDFQKFIDLDFSSGTGLKYAGKAVTSEVVLELNKVDIQSGSKSHLGGRTGEEITQEVKVKVNGYNYSPHNIKVGAKEKVLVTFSESINHFYCQLYRNLHMLDELWESVAKLPVKPQSSECPLKLHSICLAKYTDNQWYRGLIVESVPNIKVNFVDYGDTLAVLETDICPLPPEANIIRSLPVQAVPLGLYNVPTHLSQEVNKWFADHAVGKSFTISVVAEEKTGKLWVELFDGSLNVNAMVREKLSKMRSAKVSPVISKTTGPFLVSKKATVPNEDLSPSELTRASVFEETGQEAHHNDICPQYASSPQMEQMKVMDIILENNKSQTETFVQGSHSNVETTPLSLQSYPEQNAVGYMYKWPNIFQSMTVDVYPSCIAGPHYFWCQHANTEELDKVSSLAKEAALVQDIISHEDLGPGSPCLALFSEDNQWYRAQVMGKANKTVHVLFVDYGNESDIENKYVRLLPENLLQMAPQAFLCHLDGFMESSGSWDEKAYDEFYNLIVDKPLRVTILAVENDSEVAVPRHMVTAECEKIVVNKVIEKFWKSFSAVASGDLMAQTKTSTQDFQGSSVNDEHIPETSKESMSLSSYKQPEVFRSKTEVVYASCIAEPKYFWCQFANTEVLSKLSQLAQEAIESQQDVTFPQPLEPGSHCLALFPDDKQWYRALVVQKGDKTLHVLFVDYGNESDIDIKEVRPLPQCLLEKAPQAFLCRLFGFDESKGCWDDQALDFFYNLLIDKPLKLTVFGVESHLEIPFPQYSVDIECDGECISSSLQQHWKPFTEECAATGNIQTIN